MIKLIFLACAVFLITFFLFVGSAVINSMKLDPELTWSNLSEKLTIADLASSTSGKLHIAAFVVLVIWSVGSAFFVKKGKKEDPGDKKET